MEIDSYSCSGQDPHSNPLCNATKLWCADIGLAQTGSWLARQVSSLTADGRVSAPPLARTADASNVSLLYHWGHLQPPRHLSGGRCAAQSHIEAFSVCSRCQLLNYRPHCGTVMKNDNQRRVSLGGKRRHLTWTSRPVPAHVTQWAELELCPDLDIAAPGHVCTLMFTATVEQLVGPSGTEFECQVPNQVTTLAGDTKRWLTRPHDLCMTWEIHYQLHKATQLKYAAFTLRVTCLHLCKSSDEMMCHINVEMLIHHK